VISGIHVATLPVTLWAKSLMRPAAIAPTILDCDESPAPELAQLIPRRVFRFLVGSAAS
jgi:hypothetical protein